MELRSLCASSCIKWGEAPNWYFKTILELTKNLLSIYSTTLSSTGLYVVRTPRLRFSYRESFVITLMFVRIRNVSAQQSWSSLMSKMASIRFYSSSKMKSKLLPPNTPWLTQLCTKQFLLMTQWWGTQQLHLTPQRKQQQIAIFSKNRSQALAVGKPKP